MGGMPEFHPDGHCKGRCSQHRLGGGHRARRAALIALAGLALATLATLSTAQELHAFGDEPARLDKYKTGWGVNDFPNPVLDPRACGRSTSSAVCDPDHLLSREAADRMDGVIDAARKEYKIRCTATGKMHDIQVGVAVLNKMNSPGLCDENTRSGCGRAAEEYATSIYDRWGLGEPQCGNGVLIFISKKDRQMYVKTGSSTQKRLTSSKIIEMMDVMKGHLRQGHFDMALEKGLLEAVQHLSKDVTWVDRVKQHIVPAAMLGFFAAVAFSGRGGPHGREMRGAMKALTRIEEEHALALERSRGGGVVGGRWQCPVCLEDFVLDLASSAATAAVATSRANTLSACMSPIWRALSKIGLGRSKAVSPNKKKDEGDGDGDDAAEGGGKGGSNSVLRCGHRFCNACIQPWLAGNGNCPICRAPHNTPQPEIEGAAQEGGQGGEGRLTTTGASSDMYLDRGRGAWDSDDLMFRLNSLQSRYPRVITRSLLDRWRDGRVTDFRTLEKDLQHSYRQLEKQNRAYRQARRSGGGSSMQSFGGGDSKGGGGAGGSW